MENENLKGTGAQDASEFRKMFADYKKKSQTQGGGSSKPLTKEEILAKYFLPKKSKETFRILQTKGRERIEKAFFHVVPTNAKGGKINYNTIIYCPSHNDPKVQKTDSEGNLIFDSEGKPIMIPSPCPLCERAKKIMSQMDESIRYIKTEKLDENQKKVKERNDKIRKDGTAWEAKMFYIVRGIDKGLEKDGIKFWRFKHNYKGDGALDKLLPILADYEENYNLNPADPYTGTDLNIIMTDSEFNGRVYKKISAITAKGKSQLHQDPVVMEEWINDPITWRDVFKPKKAPNVTPYQYLKLVAEGNSPYWDDTDSNNKHWVFPNHPDLQEKANTRNLNLDADDRKFEYASDVNEINSTPVTINNITELKVGTYNDNAIDLGNVVKNSSDTQQVEQPSNSTDTGDYNDVDDIDDLPF